MEKSLTQSEGLGYTREALAWLGVEMEKIKTKVSVLEELVGKEVDEEFRNELIAIKGIGKNYANDIVLIFPTKEDLIKYLQLGKELPFNKNINKILKEIKWK